MQKRKVKRKTDRMPFIIMECFISGKRGQEKKKTLLNSKE
jgi:hypothetical protein